MKTFRFPLQRVLEWRALQLRVEEEKLSGLQQHLASLLQLGEKLAAERNRSQSQLFSSGTAAGSDLQSIRTTAVKDGNGYRINGSKTFISNGQIANFIVVALRG